MTPISDQPPPPSSERPSARNRALPRGRFVVIEGIDGAGTSTQVARLGDRLRAAGIRVRTTGEPSGGPIGTLVRQVLAGRLVIPGGRAPGWQTMALLFAADRLDHVESEIQPFLAEGGVVISDRYDASSVAYQSITGAGAATVSWIHELNRYAIRPDLTIVLDVPSDMAASRREGRGEAEQLYEHSRVQQELAEFYGDLKNHMHNDRIDIIDGTGTIDETHFRVVDSYVKMFGPITG